MTKLSTARINSFGLMPGAEAVPPEDPIFVLTSSQLQEIISRAIQPVKNEVMELKATVASQGEEIAALKATVAEQRADYESLNLLRCDEFAIALRRIKALQEKLDGPSQGIGKTSEKRIAELDKILKVSPNGAAPFKLIRQKLGLAPNQLSRLISSLDKRKYQVVSHPSRPKERILKAKVRWS